MPSFSARLISTLLRTTGTLRRRYSDGPGFEARIAESRVKQQFPTSKMHARVDVQESLFDGRKVFRIAPKDRPAKAELLYWHGGGYVYPAVDVHWQFYAHMADTHAIAITAPLYPLAPEADAQATLGWAERYYHAFLAERKAPFIMGGDSAGGGLCATLVHAMRDQGQILPNALMLICPWLDISVSDPDQLTIEPRDCVLTVSGAQAAGRLYARDLPLDDPRVSPIHGSWDGLPPILAFGGGDDILVRDARALKALLPTSEYVEKAGMMHDWPIFFLRESRQAQAQMADFIGKHMQ